MAPSGADRGGDYKLRWSTIDSSGSTSTGGSYSLTGTIGQPDADYARGGEYGLVGLLWPIPVR